MSFFVEGVPKAQARPRAFSRGGKAAVYNPATAEHWKQAVFLAARGATNFPPTPIATAVQLEIEFALQRPKSHFKKSGALKDSAPARENIQKPDKDNFEKAVMDALTTARLWVDDCVVWRSLVSKVWVVDNSGASVTVCWLDK